MANHDRAALPGGAGPWLYGGLFIVVLPIGLVLWARATANVVGLAVPDAPGVGWVLAVAGAALILAGMGALRIHGGGLPMNAFPPPRYVVRGIFGWIRHPIYVGFTIVCAGVALGTGSSSGLWLVTPAVALASAALVLGYERHDLRRRFGEPHRVRLALPPDDGERPDVWGRVSVYVLVFLPWFILYEAVVFLGPPVDAVSVYLGFERDWPVLEWTNAVYASAYVVVPGAVLVAGTNRVLRRFAIGASLASIMVGLAFVTLPLIAPPRPFVPQGIWGQILQIDRDLERETGIAAFPSFHVVWACLAAAVLAARWPRLAWLAWAWAVAVGVSCVTTGMHAIVDVIGGVLVFVLVDRYECSWSVIRGITERIANSWREWRVGKVRVINHGAYAGLGAFVGFLIVGVAVGRAYLPSMIIMGACAMITAALWAQIVEGESVSLRPFGYYGSIVGGIVGTLIVWAMGRDVWTPFAAFAVAAPWIQACGRFRCLVQGCCHGYETRPELGVRFVHPRSRVVRLSSLGGKPVHPTQAYSIIWNLATGCVLIRLWTLPSALTLVAGVYLLTAGIGRFVEESYRGEPQTARVGGLAIYQWYAIASVLAGIGLTCVPSAPAPPLAGLDGVVVGAAIVAGLLVWALMGVDFPESDRRFARLTR